MYMENHLLHYLMADQQLSLSLKILGSAGYESLTN